MNPRNEKYKSWDVKSLKNRFVKLRVAPELGGRILQVEMDGHEFLFVNPLLEGVIPDETRLGVCGSWLNFGGEKIWPAPQGWNTREQWSGPPDPVLDSGVYDFNTETDKNNEVAMVLQSPVDERTGLQIRRRISLEKNRAAVVVEASFVNKTNRPLNWSLWSVVQMNTPGESDGRYRVICPVNPNSKFEQGYKVMHGLANSPQNQYDTFGNVVVSYQYLVGKIGLDANAGWMAMLDSILGKVFVLRFECEENETYPDNTSMQVWTQGRGIIFSRNRIAEFVSDRVQNPPYLEMEILSPIKTIEAGKHIQFNYKMLCTTISSCNESICNVNTLAAVASPLNCEMIGENTIIGARYGVFSEGKIRVLLRINSGNNNLQETILYEKDVSPFVATDFSFSVKSRLLVGKNISLLAMKYDMDDIFQGVIEQIKFKNT